MRYMPFTPPLASCHGHIAIIYDFDNISVDYRFPYSCLTVSRVNREYYHALTPPHFATRRQYCSSYIYADVIFRLDTLIRDDTSRMVLSQQFLYFISFSATGFGYATQPLQIGLAFIFDFDYIEVMRHNTRLADEGILYSLDRALASLHAYKSYRYFGCAFAFQRPTRVTASAASLYRINGFSQRYWLKCHHHFSSLKLMHRFHS